VFARRFVEPLTLQMPPSAVWVRERTIATTRRLSTKLVPTFTDRKCRVTDPYGRILDFLDWSNYFFFHVVPLAQST
jgi:hypothetical protein